MLKANFIYCNFILFLIVTSCSNSETSIGNTATNSSDLTPIYYKKSISSKHGGYQLQIDKKTKALKNELKNQSDKSQILGSWYGKIDDERLNLMITSTHNHLISGFLVKDTNFSLFNGWWETTDNINYKIGVSTQNSEDISHYDLNLSLEKMEIKGNVYFPSLKKSSKISLEKKNINYDITVGHYPEFSQREINISELDELTNVDLIYICEEILAKHGYIFFNDEARNTFLIEQWYVPINFKVDHLLTELERANLDMIYTKF